jgi:hypothetical protein
MDKLAERRDLNPIEELGPVRTEFRLCVFFDEPNGICGILGL